VNKEDREELKDILGLIVKPIVDLQQEHHKTLFGNGSEGNQGLRVDVDRLKQDTARKDKHFFILYGSGVGLALKAGWDWISGRGGH
jgi:hypothetical protein